MQPEKSPVFASPVRAWFHVRVGGRAIPILPLLSVKLLFLCAGAFLLCIAVSTAAIELFILPSLYSRKIVASDDWVQENLRINDNNFAKIKATPEGVWQSPGLQVPPARRRARRILVVGDSFVWGDGYANLNDLWWRRLERELHRRGYLDVEVIAAGFRRHSTRNELDMARKVVPAFRPDLAIWGYVTNDPDEGILIEREARHTPLYAFWRERDGAMGILEGLKRRKIATTLAAQLERRRLDKLSASRGDEAPNVYPYDEWELRILEGENFARYRKTIADVAAFHRESGLPYFFMSLPRLPDRAYYAARLDPIARLFSENGIPWRDIAPGFADGREGTRPLLAWGIHPANSHPGLACTQYYAKRAADIIEREFPAALPPKHDGAPPPPALVVNDWFPWDLAPRQEGDRLALAFPSSRDRLLVMPHGDPHVLIAFEEAIPIRSVCVRGPGLRSARIAVVYDDPEALQEDRLEARSGTEASWTLPDASLPANALRLSAEFATDDRSLTIEIERR